MNVTLDHLIAAKAQPEVLGGGFGFTEGPAADAEGNVYFSDGKNDSIHVFHAGGGIERFVDDSTDANGMMFDRHGELYVCEGAAHRVVAIEIGSKRKRVLAGSIDGVPFNEPNDLAIDGEDGFYFSDPHYAHRGQPAVMKEDVYYVSSIREVRRVSTVCRKPNGVLLSADGCVLWVADSRAQAVYRYDVVGPGELAHESLWIAALGANPDGMALDEQGSLYVCCGAAGVKVFSPEGRPVGVIGVEYASNCVFGGKDFSTLFITSRDKFLRAARAGARRIAAECAANPRQTQTVLNHGGAHLMSDRIPMTRVGYDKLKAELDHLENVEKQKILEGLAKARAEGDLSENAEYHGARESLGLLQARINAMRDRLAHSVLMDPANSPKDQVAFGCTVRVKDLDVGEEEEFTLVGAGEEDYMAGKILVTSPLAQGMVGKKVGDTAEIQVPMGTVRYEILDIRFGES